MCKFKSLPPRALIFNIVGLADKAVAESRERVRAAFASLGLFFAGKARYY